MGKFIDLTGQKFGKLTVIEKSNTKSFGSIAWICKCECGIERKDVRTADLTRKKITSCGSPKCRKNFIDLTNKIVGKLKVIEQSNKVYENGDIGWLCICSCGDKKIIRSYSLRSEQIQSCGKYKCQNCFLDLTGKRFGKLTVLKFSKSAGISNLSYWACECDCGEKVELKASALTFGHTKSCGCLKSDDQYETIKRGLYRDHCAKAEQRNIKNFLSKEEYLHMASQNCHYCGDIGTRKNNFTKVTIPMNGLDRKNNELYYKIENSLPCCKRCNWMKGNLRYKEFIEKIRNINKYTLDI